MEHDGFEIPVLCAPSVDNGLETATADVTSGVGDAPNTDLTNWACRFESS